MADLDEEEKKTLDESNSSASDDQTDDSTGEEQQVDDQDAGKAADDASTDDNTDNGDNSEGDDKKQTRGERRHERYVDKLAKEIRDSNDNASRATQEIFAPKPYEPLKYQDGEDYDPKVLEEDRKVVADNKFAEGVQTGLTQGTSQVLKEQWADRFDIDSERVTNKWDALNPEKPEAYKPKLEANLVQKYVAFTGVQRDDKGRITIEKPNIRFKDFVDAEMQNLEDYAADHSANSSKNLAKQAAKTGVRPTSQSRTSKGGHGFDPNDPAGSVARMSSKQYFELGGKEASDAYLAKRGLAK